MMIHQKPISNAQKLLYPIEKLEQFLIAYDTTLYFSLIVNLFHRWKKELKFYFSFDDWDNWIWELVLNNLSPECSNRIHPKYSDSSEIHSQWLSLLFNTSNIDNPQMSDKFFILHWIRIISYWKLVNDKSNKQTKC